MSAEDSAGKTEDVLPPPRKDGDASLPVEGGMSNEERGGDDSQEGTEEIQRDRTEETENMRRQDKVFFVILRQMARKSLSETLSLLAKRRDSFGIAWLGLVLLATNKTLKKVGVDPLQQIDLSGTLGVSLRKIFFFINRLPSSVVEMKLDSVTVTGGALPLFEEFLERLRSDRAARKDVLVLKHLTFVDTDTAMPPHLLCLLLPSLESLHLKVCPLSLSGGPRLSALTDGVRSGLASSLRTLDLGETERAHQKPRKFFGFPLFEAIRESSSLRVETLNLSGNLLSLSMHLLCPALTIASLPSLRPLLLRNCGLYHHHISRLMKVVERGDLLNLETLDLGENFGDPSGSHLMTLARALRAGTVPHLRYLNVLAKPCNRQYFGTASETLESEFLAMLSCRQCPALESVGLQFGDLEGLTFRALLGGQYDKVHCLGLDLGLRGLTAFLSQLPEGSDPLPFESVDLSVFVSDDGSEALVQLGEALQKGPLGCLGKLKFQQQPFGVDDPVADGKMSFFSSLAVSQLPLLRELSLSNLLLTDSHLSLLAQAVHVDNLPSLRLLDCSRNRNLTQSAMKPLMAAVLENEKGLPFLEELSFMSTKAVGGATLETALASGKLGRLKRLMLGGWYPLGLESLSDDRICLLRGIVSGQIPHLEFVAQSHCFFDSFNSLFIFDLDAEGMKVFADGVRKGSFPPRLRGLGFRLRKHRPPVDVDPLILSIAENETGLPPCVASLKLRFGRIGESALSRLAEKGRGICESKLKCLKYMNLSDCCIDDHKLKELAEVFRVHECPQLKFLYLNRNKITAEGFVAFIRTLKRESLQNLSEIRLCRQLGTTGARGASKFHLSLSSLQIQAKQEGTWKLPPSLSPSPFNILT
uniref:Uncharacterized protein n=1 Tax=Chromera velia CCMP2878 TaxID=1169474 RepID=A0A0G4GGD7_9ALVE|eukprot:Cvel_21775.t1-p1 / transcript=Cvel_21775.t1 / gene=Cvel_21775 / organism=Chromera_velia_CCMP2878 / gene_product=hypothetical protein / transcript_product=hypothetical protein / location=Cvel_scaffold2072:17474-23480(-) / protein_length=870 / sequence_SO=supercontig / SO=protein_coding / is_pseudo=false